MKIVVDFDGTCVDHQFPEVGPDVPGAVETLTELSDRGDLIFLFTMRSGATLEHAIGWFRDRKIFLSGINIDPGQAAWTMSPKCYAHLYIDDAAFGVPLIHPPGFRRPCVDWSVVNDELLGLKTQAEIISDM